MKTKRENLNIIYKKIPSEQLAISISKNGKLSYQFIPQNLFVDICCSLNNSYSKDERIQQYNILANSLQYDGNSYNAKPSVFNLLYEFNDNTLTTKRYEPICQYDKLLKWNDISHVLGQDLFTTSFLAYNDCRFNRKTNYFAWNSIIDTSNSRLTHILNEGLADNHYHLYGSSQSFMLNWIALMNSPIIYKNREEFLSHKLSYRIINDDNDAVKPWAYKILWAALIRMYFFKKFNGIPCLDDFKTIKYMLKANNDQLINENLTTTNKNLTSLKFFLKSNTKSKFYNLDYAISPKMATENYNYNMILIGERKLLYDCFASSIKNGLSDYENNIFYLYLLIKTEFRNEFIQTNHYLGFGNFSDYQRRKLMFINDDSVYKNEYLKMAVCSPLATQPIKSLELRIMPPLNKNSKSLKEHIIDIDRNFIESSKNIKGVLKGYDHLHLERNPDLNFFFVIHYPKRKFSLEKDKKALHCRSEKLRISNRKITEDLVKSLSADAYLRDAIKGFDACSNEIGCRPEVFATDFRYLREIIPTNKKGIYGSQEKPVQLKLTYHVGEDFLNIVDGLRAIDEAIMFLDIQRGDRIGHALALGIDASYYYEVKGYRIITSKQDALDDYVWLLYKAREFNINIEKSLEQQIIFNIQSRIRYIYGDALKKHKVQVDSYIYYNSWKLRGDAPELYKSFEFSDDSPRSFGYNYFRINSKAEYNELRKDKFVSALYAIYHYDYDVKKKGLETETIKINPDYIKLVKQIQKKMQFLIAEKGIMIECNPTSNYLIGTFRRYDLHPITVFNNSYLEYREDEISNCPQISVSINTDDQGVFDTSLTNEYALMALALEKKKDKDGKKLYSAGSVYQYLDYVRKMGMDQRFID